MRLRWILAWRRALVVNYKQLKREPESKEDKRVRLKRWKFSNSEAIRRGLWANNRMRDNYQVFYWILFRLAVYSVWYTVCGIQCVTYTQHIKLAELDTGHSAIFWTPSTDRPKSTFCKAFGDSEAYRDCWLRISISIQDFDTKLHTPNWTTTNAGRYLRNCHDIASAPLSLSLFQGVSSAFFFVLPFELIDGTITSQITQPDLLQFVIRRIAALTTVMLRMWEMDCLFGVNNGLGLTLCRCALPIALN